MTFTNEPTLALFRGPGVCPHCNRRVSMLEAHHAFRRGLGGGSRLDSRYNLLSLCATFAGGENCHARETDGHIKRIDVLTLIAKREGLPDPWALDNAIPWVLRLDKHASRERILDGLGRMHHENARVVRLILSEIKAANPELLPGWSCDDAMA